jgi:tRNA/rRNA methyltransferase
MEMGLSGIRIILVEPAGPLNVGSVARVMKNMGLEQLILVNPRCDYLGEEARNMAVHAGDILDKAQVVPSLPDALVGCQRAIATTAQNRGLPTNLENPRNALPWLLDHPSALIFGREDRGLTNSELNYAQRFVRIPSTEVYPSLNLAQGVAICCYELYQEATQNLRQTPSLTPNFFCTDTPRASLEILEGYYQHLEDVLLKIEYLYPHTALRRMEKFRRLYNRAYPTPEEVALLRGILRQVEWAIALKGEK